MEAKKFVSGFSKMTKEEKIQWISSFYNDTGKLDLNMFEAFWHQDEALQTVLENFSENTISNFPMPFGIAPNFHINNKVYAVPMVIEESSVVAAASSAAKFWMDKGGFNCEVLGTTKIGQLHFKFTGGIDALYEHFDRIKSTLIESVEALTANMRKRGGGVLDIELVDFSAQEENYYQLRVSFETCDSMGANFINSVLEQFGLELKAYLSNLYPKQHSEVFMAILSNLTPNCIVRASVSCPVEALDAISPAFSGTEFAERFRMAVRIAEIDPYRATTHNKGIYNGVDSVVLATGNDFRAVEACGHAYAAKDGSYSSLSHCSVEDGTFKFWIDLPIALGTVGGLTKLHPLANLALELLGRPSAQELMTIIASVGLAQNFAALRSLVTTGIQKGHMKMHLKNILTQFSASPSEEMAVNSYFTERVISHSAVRDFIMDFRAQLEQ
jgi:hydroxymethylglutaryl-CoA reductase